MGRCPTEFPSPGVPRAASCDPCWPLWPAGGAGSRPRARDRYATLGPLLSVLLFLASIVLAFWYLRNEEIEREAEAVKRDTEIAQQQIRLRLIENQEQLARIAREVVTRQVDAADFAAQAAGFARDRPEITHISWLGRQLERRASVSATGFQDDSLMRPGSGDPSMPSGLKPGPPRPSCRRASAVSRSTRTPSATPSARACSSSRCR
jgi:hypothetical protein